MVLTSGPVSAVQLLGSNQSGALVSIDTTTGMGTLIGVEAGFPLATEIEFDVATGTLYSEESNGFLNLHTLDPATGLSLGFVTHGCCALTGMEFVGSTLYVSNTQVGGGASPSTLETIDTTSGTLSPVGPTGINGPLTGLAYQESTGTMYGVTAPGPAQLVAVNLGTGAATAVVPLVDAVTGGPLDRVGSIEFGSDGVLYGGMGLNASVNPGWLFRINIATGRCTFIGDTGLGGITGLTNAIPRRPSPVGIPTLGGSGLLALVLLLGVLAVVLIRRRLA